MHFTIQTAFECVFDIQLVGFFTTPQVEKRFLVLSFLLHHTSPFNTDKTHEKVGHH